MLLKFIKKWPWQVYVISVLALSMVLGYVLHGKWLGGSHIFSTLVFGPACIYAGFVDWDREATGTRRRSRREVVIRVLVVSFGAFMIFAEVMAEREDYLARKAKGTSTNTSLLEK